MVKYVCRHSNRLDNSIIFMLLLFPIKEYSHDSPMTWFTCRIVKLDYTNRQNPVFELTWTISQVNNVVVVYIWFYCMELLQLLVENLGNEMFGV